MKKNSTLKTGIEEIGVKDRWKSKGRKAKYSEKRYIGALQAALPLSLLCQKKAVPLHQILIMVQLRNYAASTGKGCKVAQKAKQQTQSEGRKQKRTPFAKKQKF